MIRPRRGNLLRSQLQISTRIVKIVQLDSLEWPIRWGQQPNTANAVLGGGGIQLQSREQSRLSGDSSTGVTPHTSSKVDFEGGDALSDPVVYAPRNKKLYKQQYLPILYKDKEGNLGPETEYKQANNNFD